MTTTEQASPIPPVPWGFWMTLAWGFVAFIIGGIVCFAAAYVLLGYDRLSGGMNDGVLLTVILGISLPVQTVVLFLAAWYRGWPAADYLALGPPRGRRDFLVAVICLVVLCIVMNVVLLAAGRDIVSPFQIETYRTAKAAGWLPGLVIVMIVFAPVAEEILFRGFLYRGWARPGYEIYAIVGITLVFAAGHTQYDWVGMLQIVIVGFVFGWFRWASGSTLLTIGMHMLVNLESTIETIIKVEFLS